MTREQLRHEILNCRICKKEMAKAVKKQDMSNLKLCKKHELARSKVK